MKPLIIIPAIGGYVTWKGAIESWEYWCNKHNIQLHIQTIPYSDNRIPMWTDKWDAIKIIKDLYPETTHVGMVDADIIVRWDCPNLFEYIEDPTKLYAVRDSGQYQAFKYMLDAWKPIFPLSQKNPENYINAGFLFMSVPFLEKITEQLWKAYENREKINYQYNIQDEQTPLNHIVDDKLILLPPMLNDMIMFNHDDYSFINQSYIWHFTGHRMDGYAKKSEIISNCWEMVKEYYI